MRGGFANAEFPRDAVLGGVMDLEGVVFAPRFDEPRQGDDLSLGDGLEMERGQVQFSGQRRIKKNGARIFPNRLLTQQIAGAQRVGRVGGGAHGFEHGAKFLAKLAFVKKEFGTHGGKTGPGAARTASIWSRHFSRRSLIFFSEPSAVGS